MKKALLVFWLLSSFVFQGYCEMNKRDSILSFLNDESLTPRQRIHKADLFCVSVYRAGGFTGDDVPMLYETMFAYFDKELKEETERDGTKAVWHQFAAWIYGNEENTEKEYEEYRKAVAAIEHVNNDEQRARIYAGYGEFHRWKGDMRIGHEYTYKAIELYDKLGNYEQIVLNLYYVGANFTEIRDTEGIGRVIGQMEAYLEKEPTVKTQYRTNTVKTAYYDVMLDDEPGNIAYMDSALIIGLRNLYLIENHAKELEGEVFAWEYYNYALAYSKRYPEGYDSIFHYLNKALELNNDTARLVDAEVEVSVYTLSAETHFAQGKYEQAEKDILYVLALLDELKEYSTVIAETHETYKFMVMFYETMNRPAEALKYQKLLQEVEKERYDNDKLNAINDMSVKYGVEKKEAQIKYLELENRTARNIIILSISLLMLLITAILFIIIINRLRKKNLEQSIYEAALLNELQQSELEHSEEEKQLLQSKYEELNELAGQSLKQAEQYNQELSDIKQQIEQRPIQLMVRKIEQLISKALIERYKREEYLERLQALDKEALEQGCLAAYEKLTNMDLKYIICFAIDMEGKDISLIFNIEPASVRTVRYRIRKKFGTKNTFRFLL